jgi:TatD DNase family protein
VEQGRTHGVPAVVHCFSEDAHFAQIMTEEYGFFLGIGGVATYPKSENVREAIRKTPLEFLLTETDAPFLVPQKMRKQGEKRNDASNLPEVVQLISELKGMDEVECGNILFANAKRFYGVV